MAQHRPIVLRSGRLTELPVGDTVAGAGFDPSALPSATAALPEAFLVRQSGAWTVASFAQMQDWLQCCEPTEPLSPCRVTVNGAGVVAGGVQVVVGDCSAVAVEINGEAVTVDGVAVTVTGG